MKNIIKYTCLAFMACHFLSCDSYLDKPPLHQISDDSWWKDATQAQMMVDNCYNYLPDHEIIPYRDGYSDNGIWRATNVMGDGSLTAFTKQVKDEWKYEEIAQLNYVLEGLEKAKDFLTEDSYVHMKAEVSFIRAWIFYDMMFYFGDIPLVDHLLTVDESLKVGRTSRNEIWKFIQTEMNEVLADVQKKPTDESGRVNEMVARSFLARISLFEKDYETTLAQTEAVMKSGKYTLYPSYENMFRPQTDGANSEIIFEFQYSNPLKLHDLNRNLSPGASPYAGWGRMMALENMVDEYECIEGHFISECESFGCKHVSERQAIDAAGKYGEYEFRDPRLKQTIITPGWEWIKNDAVAFVFDPADENGLDYIKNKPWSTGYSLTKWVDMNGENEDRTKAYKNITLIRYADILLMRAEALIESGGDLQEAADLINLIRSRAGMPQIDNVGGQSEMREKLRHERRIELAFEGLRYYDIIRWRIGDKVRNGDQYGAALMNKETGKRENIFMEKRVWDDHMYLWPVPQDARDLNPSLDQNPGW